MFRDVAIKSSDLDDYKEHIPQNYHGAILSGQMSAYFVFDDVGDSSKEFGLYVNAVHDGWLELVWIYLADPDTSTTQKALFLEHVISTDTKRRAQNLKGAFIEVHEDEAWDDALDCLRLCGMEARLGDGNVYEFSLSQVKGADTFKKAALKINCISLAEADQLIKKRVRHMAIIDERPVPVSDEIDWDLYLQDLSFISMKGDNPSGVILISQKEEYLVIDLCYSADTLSLPALLGRTLEAALESLGPDQKVLVPVVVNKTELLIEKIVPDAYRTKIINGLMRF